MDDPRKLTLTFVDGPDEEELFAEITLDEADFARVVRRNGRLLMTVYWTISNIDFYMDDLTAILDSIRAELTPRSG